MKTWKWVIAISAVLLFAVWAFDYLKPKPTPKVQEAATAVQEQAEVVRQTRTESTRQIRKAVKQAVEKADSISDDSVCAEFNTVISGARERNTERRCADSAD